MGIAERGNRVVTTDEYIEHLKSEAELQDRIYSFAGGLRTEGVEKPKAVIELNDETRWILGRPNFTCIGMANGLRARGHKIKNKAEDEQAAVIYWMLLMYIEHGDKWREHAVAYLKPEVNEYMNNPDVGEVL